MEDGFVREEYGSFAEAIRQAKEKAKSLGEEVSVARGQHGYGWVVVYYDPAYAYWLETEEDQPYEDQNGPDYRWTEDERMLQIRDPSDDF